MPTFLHGTSAMWRNGCRCNLCTLVHAVDGAPEKPMPQSVSATEASAHIAALREAGWTIQAIADRSGYHRNTIDGIAKGRTLWTSRFIAEDVCSIPVGVAA